MRNIRQVRITAAKIALRMLYESIHTYLQVKPSECEGVCVWVLTFHTVYKG